MDRQGKLLQVCACAGKFVVNFLSTAAMLFLFAYAMRSSFSHWNDEWNEYTELLLPRMQDNMAWNIIILLLMLLFIFVVFYFWNKHFVEKQNHPVARWMVAAVVLIWSIVLVVNLKATPTADRAVVIDSAAAALGGNWKAFEPDGYMAFNPQQIGLFSILYLLMKLIPGGWWYYQIINGMALAGTLLVGGALARKLWKKTHTDKLYMLLQLVCVPAYFYTCYVYGEIVSTFLCVCTIYMVADAAGQGMTTCKLAMIAFLMFGAMWIRKNALIAMIALVLCAAWKAVAERHKRYVKIVLALLLSLGIYKIAGNLIFSNQIKHYDSMPAISWVVMGMEKNALGYGAFNAFSNLTFTETGYNAELTKQESYKKIRKILEYYRENPKEAAVFLKEKILWQWTDPDYESMYSALDFKGDDFFQRVYYGDLRLLVWNLLNWYQNLIYFGLLFAFLYEWRNKNNGMQIIFQVIFLGYFFFCILWEAKPRYMVMCFLLMLPMAAYGLGQFCREMEKLVGKLRRQKRLPDEA